MAGRAHFMTMLITLELSGVFCPNTGMQNGDKASPMTSFAVQALLVKKGQNFWTAWYILIKFCMLMYFNIKPLVCKTVTRLHRATL